MQNLFIYVSKISLYKEKNMTMWCTQHTSFLPVIILFHSFFSLLSFIFIQWISYHFLHYQLKTAGWLIVSYILVTYSSIIILPIFLLASVYICVFFLLRIHVRTYTQKDDDTTTVIIRNYDWKNKSLKRLYIIFRCVCIYVFVWPKKGWRMLDF